MTPRQALAFLRKLGVVLESARGPVPSLAEEIAGEAIRGSWWVHPRSQEIFAVTRALRDSGDVLVCRAVEGKITFVHRRLWPALVRVAEHLPAERLAKIEETHTADGKHELKQVPFPEWVPAEVLIAAQKMSVETALADLGQWLRVRS
jgi:hypothetical protein